MPDNLNIAIITNIILLALTVIASLYAVMRAKLIACAIWLAITSVLISILMYNLGGSLAAVFELSVCAGLITVVFISVISLTSPQSIEKKQSLSKQIKRAFWALPVLLILAGIWLEAIFDKIVIYLPKPFTENMPVSYFMWNFRQTDLLAQIIILLVGALGVLILFKLKGKDDSK